ncbi:MAG: threonine/serine dehydratase [Planctomycetota bacterium]
MCDDAQGCASRLLLCKELMASIDSTDVRAAAKLIAAQIERTPLFAVPPALVARADVRLFLKLECRQRSGSFKARGARHFVARLLAAGSPPAGVITYSSGNHGTAVAEAGRDAGLGVLVTVPENVDAVKESAMRAAGAEVVRAGGTSESRRERALAIAAERGWAVIPPFDHDWIIAGQGTVALEILDEVPNVVGVWTPVGGGGLAAGVTTVVKDLLPACEVFAVEPAGAACFGVALRSGRRVPLGAAESMADGLLPLEVGARNWEILSTRGVRSVLVSEGEIRESLRRLRGIGVATEPSGAVAAAPLIAAGGAVAALATRIPPGVHVAIVSGGNVAPARLASLLA